MHLSAIIDTQDDFKSNVNKTLQMYTNQIFPLHRIFFGDNCLFICFKNDKYLIDIGTDFLWNLRFKIQLIYSMLYIC